MDALGSIHEYRGIARPMIFDTTWSNVAEPLMVRLVDGRFVPLETAEPAAAAPATGAPLRIGLMASEGVAGEGLATGARAAIGEINAAGGIAGRPLELQRLAAGSPWRDGASRLAQLATADDLIALVGADDGAMAHVAAQLASRRRIPYLSASAEVSLTRAGVPWVLRGVPSDRAQAETLLAAFGDGRAPLRAVLVVPAGREGRERLVGLREACTAQQVRIVAERSGGPMSDLPAADVVLVWLDAEDAVEALRTLDAAPTPALLGSHRLLESAVLQVAAEQGHALLLPALGSARRTSLSERLGYDLIRRVAEAARTAGITPEALRDALLADPEFVGRTGAMRFDAAGNRLTEMEAVALPASGTGIADVSS
jgi:ABC-type branched-subunit amino acid transport system substrate-binding protein